MFDWIKGDEETGMEALGGLGGLAGSTVAGPDWTLACMRFSISSMSDWEEGWRGTVSLWDIFNYEIALNCKNQMLSTREAENKQDLIK